MLSNLLKNLFTDYDGWVFFTKYWCVCCIIMVIIIFWGTKTFRLIERIKYAIGCFLVLMFPAYFAYCVVFL